MGMLGHEASSGMKNTLSLVTIMHFLSEDIVSLIDSVSMLLKFLLNRLVFFFSLFQTDTHSSLLLFRHNSPATQCHLH